MYIIGLHNCAYPSRPFPTLRRSSALHPTDLPLRAQQRGDADPVRSAAAEAEAEVPLDGGRPDDDRGRRGVPEFGCGGKFELEEAEEGPARRRRGGRERHSDPDHPGHAQGDAQRVAERQPEEHRRRRAPALLSCGLRDGEWSSMAAEMPLRGILN